MTLELAKRLREAAQGSDVCPTCGNERNKLWKNKCPEEGQCDWNMHYGAHTDSLDDPWQAKIDMLEAAAILGQY
jgi:hypothetical protein